MTDARQISYGQELARKGIHLMSLLIPVIYLQVDTSMALMLLVPATVLALIINMLMQWHGPTRRVMMRFVGEMLRDHELDGNRLVLNGASWVLISATAMVALMPKVLGVTSFTILIISDTFAALIGRRWGRRRFLDKSVVGSMTFFLTAVMCVVVYAMMYALPWTFLAAGIAGAAVGTVTEAASVRLRVDDNLSIPFSIAITMWLLATLFASRDLPAFLGAMT